MSLKCIINEENFKLDFGINTLIVKNAEIFRTIYNDLSTYIKILDGIDECQQSAIFYIKEPLSIAINDKKNLTYLFKSMAKFIKETHEEEYNKLITEFKMLFNNISDEIDSSIEFEEVDINKLFQSFNVKYQEEQSSFIEEFITYIDVEYKVNKIKLFISYNLHNYLTNEEYKQISKELRIKQIVLLDICRLITNISKEELLVIDEDCCII